jgi:hypothetical protein
MYLSNPRDERRHYPIILQRLKHIGVMETLENIVDENDNDESWNTPRPVAWSPSLASFHPPTLILVTNSSNLILHRVAVSFWWKEIGRMVECGGRRTTELQIDRDGARSKGGPNRARNPLGRSERDGRPRPFLGRFGPIFLPAAHLGILDFPPWFVSFWGRHPRDQGRGLIVWSPNFTS